MGPDLVFYAEHMIGEVQDRLRKILLQGTDEVMHRLAARLGPNTTIRFTDGLGTRFFEIIRVFPGFGARRYVIKGDHYYTDGHMKYGYYHSGDRRMKKLFEELQHIIREMDKISSITNMDFDELSMVGFRRPKYVERAPEPDQKIKKVCKYCDSDDLVRDAVVRWDVDQQEWVLSTTFDDVTCCSCNAEGYDIDQDVPVSK